MRTSYSALDTYKTCPLKYKYQAVDKIRGKKSKEQVFGTAVHKALHFMFKRNPLYPTLDEVLNFYMEYWGGVKDKIVTASGGIPPSKNFEISGGKIADKEREFYLEEGKNILKKFYAKNQPWNFNVLDLESRFEVLIDDPERGENHVLAGIMDRIDKPEEGQYEIIDYKTSRRMPGQDIIDKDLQLSIYNLGLIKRWPHIKPENVKLSLYFVAHGEKISSVRPPEALEETKKEVLNTIREIQEREKKMDFPPMPGPWCEWCPYKPICPMWKHLYKKPETPSDEEIKAIVREYFQIKNEVEDKGDRIKMLQQKIHQYLDENGLERVFGEEGYITRRVSEKPIFDVEKVKAILEPLGKWAEAVKPDEKKLEKISKELPPAQKKEFEQAVKEQRRITTLSISRKKMEEEEVE